MHRCPLCPDWLGDDRDALLKHVAEDHLGGGLLNTKPLDSYLSEALEDPAKIAAVRAQIVLWLRSLAVDLMPTETELRERADAEPMAEALTVADVASAIETGYL